MFYRLLTMNKVDYYLFIPSRPNKHEFNAGNFISSFPFFS